jgi:hypothetical protein
MFNSLLTNVRNINHKRQFLMIIYLCFSWLHSQLNEVLYVVTSGEPREGSQ